MIIDEIKHNLQGRFKEYKINLIDSPPNKPYSSTTCISINQTKYSMMLSEFIYDILIDKKLIEPDINSIFHSDKIPNMDLNDYISRIVVNSRLEENEIIFLGLLIKYFEEYTGFIIKINNIFKLISSCLLITVKYLKDKILSFDNYSKITGESKLSLILLEDAFLSMTEYNIYQLEGKFAEFKENFIYLYKDY